MKVLIDTCVWSAVLRRSAPDESLTRMVTDLITDGRAVLIGPVKQEILSGLRSRAQFTKLRDILAAFEEISLKSLHFERAAEFSNTCRSHGVQSSTIDFLICAVAHEEQLLIFTTDQDFQHYTQHLPVQLYK